MNYTLHQLRIFVSITETLSITKSAELLNLTQPAISIQLRNFQQQFDYPLIEIIQRKIHVTPLGKEIAIQKFKLQSPISIVHLQRSPGQSDLSATDGGGRFVGPHLGLSRVGSGW